MEPIILEHEFDKTCLAVGLRMMLLVGQMNNFGANHIEQFVKLVIPPQKSEADYFVKAQADLEQWLLWMSSTNAMKEEQIEKGSYPEEFVMLCSKFAAEYIAEKVRQKETK